MLQCLRLAKLQLSASMTRMQCMMITAHRQCILQCMVACMHACMLLSMYTVHSHMYIYVHSHTFLQGRSMACMQLQHCAQCTPAPTSTACSPTCQPAVTPYAHDHAAPTHIPLTSIKIHNTNH